MTLSNSSPSLAAVCLAGVLAACAARPPQAPADAKSTAATPPPGCVTDTGTRLPPGDHRCSAPGRSYTGEEVRNTGAVSAAQALQQLDPSVTMGPR